MFVKEVIELNSEQFRNCDLGDERMDSLAGETSPALPRKQPQDRASSTGSLCSARARRSAWGIGAAATRTSPGGSTPPVRQITKDVEMGAVEVDLPAGIQLTNNLNLNARAGGGVHVHACVRACARACVRASERACVRAHTRRLTCLLLPNASE
jgi:hypothetical protein